MTDLVKTPMADLRKKAAVSLSKRGLKADGQGGVRVYLVLDHSWSMDHWYDCGAVQKLTEQALALGAELDSDGEVEAWFFEDGVSQVHKVRLHRGGPMTAPDFYEGWVDRKHPRARWGCTNYVGAMNTVAAYHAEHGQDEPGLVIFQTDGSPDDETATEQALRDLAGQKLFFAFVGFGTRRQVAFLTKLDQIGGRVRDNASALVVEDFRTIDDDTVYDGILGEFIGQWLPQVL